MITEAQINEILTKHHMTKLSISTYPTWMDKNRQEGIELRGGQIIPFWNKDGQRVYEQPASDSITKTIELINGVKINEKSTKNRN